jgi:catechol 2,3-dioxygenase-like lactoylglutathione lyase family enzyme
VKLYALLLYVDSLERSLAFYRDALGMKVVRAESGHFAELALGDSLLCLHQTASLGGTTSPKTVVLQLDVADVDAMARSIAGKNVPVKAAPSDRSYGVRQLDLTDPDGYRVALVQPLRRS